MRFLVGRGEARRALREGKLSPRLKEQSYLNPVRKFSSTDPPCTSSSSPTDPEPLQPPLGIRCRLSLSRARRKNQIIPLYMYHCSRLPSYGLFWVTIYIAPAIHTLTLLFSDAHSLINIHVTADASSAPRSARRSMVELAGHESQRHQRQRRRRGQWRSRGTEGLRDHAIVQV